MRWRTRHQRDRRRTVTSRGAVAAAIAEAAAGGPLTRRHPEAPAELEELPDLIEVEASSDVDGFDTVVWFDDEINSYCDPHDDGLDQALADQSGIEEVLPEDRSPREPEPDGSLSPEAVEALAPAVRPVLRRPGSRTLRPASGTSDAKVATDSSSRSRSCPGWAPPGTGPLLRPGLGAVRHARTRVGARRSREPGTDRALALPPTRPALGRTRGGRGASAPGHRGAAGSGCDPGPRPARFPADERSVSRSGGSDGVRDRGSR